MISQEEESQSNNTTPRGSMEFLPPPPPHLLHSDEEEETKRGLSVAESVKELQRRQVQGSPTTLRRVQSMSAAPSPGLHTERHHLMAKLDAALASPRPAGPRSVSPGVRSAPQQDQIYAPVAALQQKIQQQQAARLQQAGHCPDPGLVPHPPGPVPLPHQSSFSTPNKNNHNNTEGEEYGFGMQFQVQSNNFYQHQQHPQQQHHQHPQHPQQQQHRPPGQGYGLRGGGGHYPQYPQTGHDQIMSEMDHTLSHRPQPPGWQNGVDHSDPASALKVRHWIETRTVSDVRKVRPVLNQQIQQGFQLRKATGVKDRSQPRF